MEIATNKVWPRPIPAASGRGSRRGIGANFVVEESAPPTHPFVADSSPKARRRGILRSHNKKFARFLLSIALIAFLSVAFFGASQSMMGMEQRSDGTMGGCLFTGMEEICEMTFTQHLTEWQSMFTTTVTKNTFTDILLLLLAVVFVAVAVFKRNLLLLFSHCTTRWRLYIRYNPELSLFNPLKEAFARGILNPKIY